MLNLIINAIEAMSDVSEKSRVLLISTGRDEPNGVLVACRIPAQEWIRSALTACSTHSTRPSRVGWAWDYRFAVRSSKLTGDECGRLALPAGARPFSSPCLYGEMCTELPGAECSGLAIRNVT